MYRPTIEDGCKGLRFTHTYNIIPMHFDHLFLLLTLVTLFACNSTPPETDVKAPIAEQTPAASLELVEQIDYEADSTLKVVYQVVKGTDKRSGSYKQYNVSNNILRAECMYQDNKIEGTEKLYYIDGKLEAEIGYTAGIHNGPFKYYYRNGQVKQEGVYQEGKIEGLLKTYYSDGQLREEVTHVNGVTEGPFKEYNENGTLSIEGNFTSRGDAESLEEGLVKFYDENGTLERRAICKQGQCCTIWTAKRGDVAPNNKLCEAILEEYNQIN